MKWTSLLSSLVFASALVACGGGGGGSGSGSTTASGTTTVTPYNQAAHDALAQQFIAAATAEGLGFTLIKQDTQLQGYIVVETSSGVYEAFDVDNWTPGTLVSSFSPDFTGLSSNGDGTYSVTITTTTPGSYGATVSDGTEYGIDLNTGEYGVVPAGDLYDAYTEPTTSSSTYTFEVAQPTSKDLQKIAAFRQAYALSASTKKIQSKFGVSLERAQMVAKLALQVKNTPKMSDDDYDSLSQQLLGVPVAKLDSAIKKTMASDPTAKSDVDDIIDQAAKTNGVGTEQARSLYNTLIGGIQN